MRCRLLVWGALCGTPFAMPNSIFEVYGQVARVLSCFYIIVQLIILLDFFYWLNEWLLEHEWNALVVASTVVLIVGSFVGCGFLYKVGSVLVWADVSHVDV